MLRCVGFGAGAECGAMSTIEQQLENADGAAVLDWRFEILTHAGYPPDDAWILATSKNVDLRLAERLLAEGCPRMTALRILL
jgi:hypothetical protein